MFPTFARCVSNFRIGASCQRGEQCNTGFCHPTSSTCQPSEGACPEQMLNAGGICLGLPAFRAASWTDARAACPALFGVGAALVSPINRVEQQNLQTFLVLRRAAEEQPYIGISDLQREGEFVFDAGGAPVETFSAFLAEDLALNSRRLSCATHRPVRLGVDQNGWQLNNSGKVLQPSYEQKLQLSALQQQSVHGPCRPDALPPLGVLDVIGRDRRQAWQALGELSRPEAMTRYIELLDSVCATFRPYAEAHKCDLEAKQRKLEEEQNSARQELQEQEEGRQRLEQMAIQQEQEEARRQEETKRHIKEALNQQTRAQFRAYAEQQYPGSPDQCA
ncbi:Golgi resident protein GCP60 [Amphibalanus amphitrite]|uniref:Golgi resident protein GCP60 n=1 Tax=Amphibalanus amphitrite TaxID=1232801 RepID=A0A6A4WI73_AMPAM|nr:Golgi resident protein GCP60 [Amphibalanus amphitrite]